MKQFNFLYHSLSAHVIIAIKIDTLHAITSTFSWVLCVLFINMRTDCNYPNAYYTQRRRIDVPACLCMICVEVIAVYLHINAKNMKYSTESSCDCMKSVDFDCNDNVASKWMGKKTKLCEFSLLWFPMGIHPMVVGISMYTVPVVHVMWPAGGCTPETFCWFAF